MSDDIEEQVRQIVAKKLRCDPSAVRPDADLIADLDADSLELVELVYAMERAFKINIPDDEADKFRTVAHAVQFIRSHLT